MFSKEQLLRINFSKLPKHICVVMDGNRRWASLNKKSKRFGHVQGAEAAISLARAAKFLGIQRITAFAFSTENWSRPNREVRSLMSIFRLYLYRMRKEMIREGMRFLTIGDISSFPSSLIKSIEKTKKDTEKGQGLDIALALNYGGRDEIRRATIRAMKDFQKGNVDIENFTEEQFASYLDTASSCDPDLFIRTSGEQRISNFLLWQISYSELYITETLWPDFTKDHLIDAIVWYQQRERRLGG